MTKRSGQRTLLTFEVVDGPIPADGKVLIAFFKHHEDEKIDPANYTPMGGVKVSLPDDFRSTDGNFHPIRVRKITPDHAPDGTTAPIYRKVPIFIFLKPGNEQTPELWLGTYVGA